MKSFITSALVLSIICLGFAPVLASEISGVFAGVTLTAPVIPEVTPDVPPPPPPSGGGGGGGSGGGGSSTPSTFRGDANKDGRVDIIDFALLMAQWNKTSSINSADFNSDNRVDVLDFVILMTSWNK